MSESLETLEAKLAAAVGPDRELDGAFAIELGWKRHPLEKTHFFDPAGKYHRGAPRYTSSIDTALTLVPEGMAWMVGYSQVFDSQHPFYAAYVDPNKTIDENADQEIGVAPTPALALCLAAIRARQLAEPLSEGHEAATTTPPVPGQE